MKIKVTKTQQQLGPPVRSRGNYSIRETKWGSVVCKWPRPRSGKYIPANAYKQGEFSLAAQWASNPSDMDLVTATELARGTAMVPRDFIMGAIYGTHFQPYTEEGVPWTSYRSVTVNGQLVLDQVTDEIGEMMWRAQVGWIGIPAGSNGQILINDFGTPKWAQYLPPGEAQPILFAPNAYIDGTGGTIANNSFTGSPVALAAGTQINALAVQANTASASTVLQPALYFNKPSVSTNRVALGPQVTGLVDGWNFLPLTAPVPITDSGTYFAMVVTTGASWSCVSSNATSMGITCTFTNPPGTTFPFLSQGTDATRARVWAAKI